ncbi:MAG: capsular polysaccharide biosynthesis protein CapK [Puniceicoccaceae bacterium 5H]|nr:MAG: capsular polysaccharide biosynthesis protein CapK [Puniceicoccaceae bacterium 5H]
MNPFASAYDVVFRRCGPALADRVRRAQGHALFCQAQQETSLPLDLQQAALNARVLKLLQAAQHVPHYADAFAERQLEIEPEQPLNTLQALPVLTKDDLKRDPQSLVMPGYEGPLPKIQTAGSTGSPLKAYVDPVVPSVVTAAMYLGRSWWGVEPGSRSVSLWGHSKYLADSLQAKVKLARRHLFDAAMNRRVFPAYDLGPEKLKQFWNLIAEFQPAYVVGYATALSTAAEYLNEHGATPKLQRALDQLKAVVSTGEMLYDWQAETIRQAFDAPAVREYGLCEAGSAAYEHPDGHLYAISPFYHIELLDEQGQPVAPGGLGRIVITSLLGTTVPLIRYDTGDLAREVAADPKAPLLRRLGPVQGRAYDLIYTADGSARPGVLFTHAMKYLDEVERYQIVQNAYGQLDVYYACPHPLNEDRLRVVRERLHSAAAGDIALHFHHRAQLEQEASGKFRWIKSNLPNRRTA